MRSLGADGRDVRGAEGWAVVEQVAERPTAQVLEDEVRTVHVLAPVVDRDEVGVGERGCGLRLRAEAPEEGAVGRQHRVQHLYRHAPLEADVRSQIHVRRSARAYRRLDPVATGQDATDRVCESCHGSYLVVSSDGPFRGPVPPPGA